MRLLAQPYRRAIAVGVGAAVVVAVGAAPASASSASVANVYHESVAGAHETPDTFSYQGRQISRDAAARQGLSCNELRDGVVCFDSQTEALTAAGSTPDKPRAASSRRTRPQARTSVVCSVGDGRPLVVWQTNGEGGWNLNLWIRMEWWGLGGAYDNEVGSYRMGEHSGHLAENQGGGGFYYPGPTGICNNSLNTGAYAGWDNRVSSRYRN
jgi:hypothetical protein